MLQSAGNLFYFLITCYSVRQSKQYYRRMTLYLRWAALFTMILIVQAVSAQDYNISVSARSTHIIGTNAFFRGEANNNGIPIDRANIYAIRIGKRLSADKYWHYAYKYPEVGIGIEYLNIHNSGETGKPLSIYTFIEAGLVDRDRFRLSLSTDFGLAYFWKPFNTTSNPNNVAIGSQLNYHVGLGLRANYFLTENIAVLVATMLNHHSNGAVTKPNLGMNMASVEVGLKYYLQKRQKRKQWTDTLRRLRAYSDLSLFTGSRNIDIDGQYYMFYGIHANRMWPIWGKFAFGSGVELLYDEATFVDVIEKSLVDQTSIAAYVSAMVIIDKVSLSMDIGRYLYRKEEDRDISNAYQRLSLRYQLTDHLFLAAKVRAFELRKADLLEFHIGWRL